MQLAHYAKAIYAVVMSALGAAILFATEGSPEYMWLTITIAGLTPLGVYLIPNAEKKVTDGRHELGRDEDYQI